MAFWNELHTMKEQKLINFGTGINTFNDPLTIKDEELTDCSNICSDNYPIVRTRNDRIPTTNPNTTSKVYGLGQRNNTYIHVLTSDSWRCSPSSGNVWATVAAITNSTYPAKFVEFNTQTDKYTICAVGRDTTTIDTFNSAYTSNSTTVVSLTSNSPRTALYTVNRYRVYAMGVDKRTLYYTAQGTCTDWVTAGDAGYIDVTEIKGQAKAITTYADHVIVWSDNSMHELYGTYSENFELVNVSNSIGCVGLNAYAECNGRLYWLDYSGIYMYTGGLPRQVALEAKKYIQGINWDKADIICAGAVNGKVYFNVPYGTTTQTINNKIIVVDTRHTDQYGNPQYVVCIEEGDFVGFTNNGESLYGMNSSNSTYVLYDMLSTRLEGYDGSTAASTNQISWSFETKPFSDPGINLISAIKDIWVEHSGTTDASLNLKYTTNTNSTTFTSFASSSDFTYSTHAVRDRLLPTSTQFEGVPFVKFQFSGSGHKKISSMKIDVISWGELG